MPPENLEQAGSATGVSIDHAVVAVSNWEAAIRFYRDVVGATVVDHPDGKIAFRLGSTQLNVHGPGLEYGELVASPPVTPGGLDLCVTWAGTVDELLRHLVRMDVAVLEGPVPRYGARGLGQSVYVRDPDGSLLEFIVYA